MPFVRISLLRGRSPDDLAILADNVHRALVEAFVVPRDDRFQIIHQLEPGELIYNRDYLGGPRSNDFVLIHVTAGKPRSRATRQALYRRLTALLADAPGINPEDVMVVISTTGSEDWSFGGGVCR
ncbi:tautomerase family protein [Marinobacter halodurans]|uniref:Tautomerase family protein n=1 Tax=Marinobacter halodurans TaxID=2528979 RepID=A0ABY1ZHZ0_9GAMM|nr:tautomerase family protein [Marinobacter halodurans]TBW53330.1 tautomerase family protein [Marinobacter halodurans]